MRVRTPLLLLSFSALTFLATVSRAQTLDEYLRKEGYSPLPQHNSNWVPGGILRVNWKTGEYNYQPPPDDLKGLGVEQGSTQQLDFGYNANAKDGGAAASGISSLFNAVGIKITGGGNFTFSGINFTTSALKGDPMGVQTLLDNRNGATYKYLVIGPSPSGILFGTYDAFIITEVEFAKSASIHSSSYFSVSGTLGGADPSISGCKLPTAAAMPKAPGDGDAGGAAGNGTPAPATGDGAAKSAKPVAANGASDATKPTTDPQNATKTETTPTGTKKSTTPPTSETTSGAAQTKADSVVPIKASLGYEQCSENEGAFSSPTPIPTALKVMEVYLLTNGDLKVRNYGDNVAVPLDDSNLLRRLRECSRVGGTPALGCRKY
jgi:hypothetical protein